MKNVLGSWLSKVDSWHHPSLYFLCKLSLTGANLLCICMCTHIYLHWLSLPQYKAATAASKEKEERGKEAKQLEGAVDLLRE